MKTKLIYIVLTVLIFILPGCYTVLVHPEVELQGNEGTVYSSSVNFYDDCSSCHSEVPDGNMESMNTYDVVKAHLQGQDNDFYGYYSAGYYYDSYDYYYNIPWWTQYTPVVKDREKDNYTGSARNNDSERGSASERRRSTNFTSPAVSTSSSSSSSSGSTSSSSSSSSTQTNKSSSNESSTRSSSDAPQSRNNDGNRSSDSGRRK